MSEDSLLNFQQTALDLAAIDREMGRGNLDIPALFKDVPIDVFGKLLLDVPRDYPNIRTYFPTMAPADVQERWTGSSGETLLKTTVAFVRSMLSAYYSFGGRRLHEARILDFGCGYGRIMRLMYKYCAEKNIFAVDPWDQSINLCREHKMRGQVALSDWIPSSLPYHGPFDLIYAFSVFTHLSEKTAKTCFRTLRNVISDSGLLVVSIRPPEYWKHHQGGKYAAQMGALHDSQGFAFLPPNGNAASSEATYGDASMSLDYIRRACDEWRVVGIDWNSCDHFQSLLFLQPAVSAPSR